MNWIKEIETYEPYNEQEKKDKEIIFHCIDRFEDIFTRNNEIIHFTSSAFIVNNTRDKTLMVHHNIYNSWSWTGGHADGEENLLKVALKEAGEETGINKLSPLRSGLISLDIIPVQGHMRRGVYVAPHLHISAAYLIEGDENESLSIKPDENSGVKWIPLNEIDKYSDEPHMKKIYNKIILKIAAKER